MKARLLLADFAKVSDGKIDALGLGWTTTSTPLPPLAIVLMLQAGWDETNTPSHFTVELLTADGQPVEVPGPMGTQAVTIEGDFEAGRPPGLPHGTPVDMPIAVVLGPGMPLQGGHRYEWRLTINGETHEDWTAAFYVRP